MLNQPHDFESSPRTKAVDYSLFFSFFHDNDDLLSQLQYLISSTPDDFWFDGLAVMESLVDRARVVNEEYWERASRGQGAVVRGQEGL